MQKLGGQIMNIMTSSSENASQTTRATTTSGRKRMVKLPRRAVSI
jgi:hypothetical protein